MMKFFLKKSGRRAKTGEPVTNNCSGFLLGNPDSESESRIELQPLPRIPIPNPNNFPIHPDSPGYCAARPGLDWQ
jgi:hypothetical protein